MFIFLDCRIWWSPPSVPVSCVPYVGVEVDGLVGTVGGRYVSFATGLQPARVPVVVFGKVLVAVEAFRGLLSPYAIADRPPERFHEGDAGCDDAKINFESNSLVSGGNPWISVLLTFWQKHYRFPPLQISELARKFEILIEPATYRSYHRLIFAKSMQCVQL